LIPLNILLQIISVLCFVAAFTIGPARAETSPDELKPSASHGTVREKMISVPPEVLKRWRAIRLVIIDKMRGTENIYTVPVGTPFTVPSSPLTITVEVFLPSFAIQGTTITTSSNKPVNPGAKVKITENGTPVFQGWLFSKFPNTHAVTHPKYGFSLIGGVPSIR
jgi:hypothetical protein